MTLSGYTKDRMELRVVPSHSWEQRGKFCLAWLGTPLWSQVSPNSPLGPSHLQGTGEEVSEGLHSAERVLQRQLLGVFAQVVSQLQLLLLNGVKHLVQCPRGLNAGLRT